MRTAIDPQQKKYMDEDIKRLTEIGVMRYNENGLFSFKRFMHLFILITRHSKEMAIKEERKVRDKRRVAFRLRNWKVYREIVQHELDMEKLKYLDTVNYVLEALDLEDGAYRSSYVKYSRNRERDLQMKDARKLVHQDIENAHIE